MALRELLRSPLTRRIYLVGLAQLLVIAAGFVTILLLNEPEARGPAHGHARVARRLVGPLLEQPEALEAEVRRLEGDLGITLEVRDPAGKTRISSLSPREPPCEPEGHGPPPRGGRTSPCAKVPIQFPLGGEGQLLVLLGRPGPRPPPVLAQYIVPFVLLVVGASALLLAASLTRPLRRLSAAATAFGRGELSARAGLARRDELGDVSRAFDEMAGRLVELLRAEKELLANVSHELRTPLARIRVALDLAAEGDVSVARESLVDIASDLEELERLVEDVLTAARLDLSSTSPRAIPPLRREPLDLPTLLAQAASRFRAAHPNRPLALDVLAEWPAFVGDPVLLRRVIDNLLENAHKYTEEPEAAVEVFARPEDERVVIEIRDRGIGIAELDLSGVFRPFYRVDRSRTRATGGHGLGLALAQKIVVAHGGQISLAAREGGGTVARVELPWAPTGDVDPP
jgi:two-component system OmpR family sensor kinase